MIRKLSAIVIVLLLFISTGCFGLNNNKDNNGDNNNGDNNNGDKPDVTYLPPEIPIFPGGSNPIIYDYSYTEFFGLKSKNIMYAFWLENHNAEVVIEYYSVMLNEYIDREKTDITTGWALFPFEVTGSEYTVSSNYFGAIEVIREGEDVSFSILIQYYEDDDDTEDE
jgi:hypothetical protein